MVDQMAEANCPVCEGTGWKIVERAGLSGVEQCPCAAISRGRSIKESAGIPPNYENATLDNFQVPQDNPTARLGLGTVLMQVKSFVREFPTADKPGLLLVGDTGTGKTHLAVAALKALLDKGHAGVFFDYQNLLDRIRSGYDRTSGTSDKEAYGSALEADILLLDDLGSHRVTDWVEDIVTSMITYRCNHRKPLIATTNVPDESVMEYKDAGGVVVSKKTLAEVIGTRARSRLHEMCRVVKMPAVEDYRLRRG
jgi:DNA replication protein DnaC